MDASRYTNPDDAFVELLAKNQVRLRSYIATLVRDSGAADDLLQEASMALWKNRKAYDSNRDFFRWACGMALIEVLRFRRKAATDKLLFDEALLNTLAADYIKHVEDWDRREIALSGCLQKLSAKDRWLLDARYRSDVTTAQIAQQLGKPLSTIYSSLSRIRETLFRCVQSAIAQESHPSI
ncbi:MAG TPA: sigma-70 family RNA polymerase sigma factor [Pirellulales bacterium]|jgi:RNA polymerase sigma-70 factor (ECF subfamily)|nr:sigma-70 family RNA polymerase sigma factor [Pirellulales bacterium]